MPYYNRPAQEILSELKASEQGLSSQEAVLRLKQVGLNQLVSKKKISPVLMFLAQFRSFIIYILLFAVFVSLLSHEYVDAAVILLILLFNAFFGFIQEYKAEKAIEALKRLAGLKVQVVRDGQSVLLDTKELVPGDIIIIEEGNKTPADARIIEASCLQVTEASLTGESVPVSKCAEVMSGELALADQKNMLFSGTAVTKGRAKAIVVATGMQTEIGKIAGMLTDVEDDMTPLQRNLDKLGSRIGMATIAICIAIFVVGVVKEGDISFLLSGDILGFLKASKEWLLTAVSLAVAAVPEGLPAVVTIALAIGVKKMVKRNALIRRLPSVETLGEATVICSDKTGTLTKNEMTVQVAYTNGRELQFSGSGYDAQGGVSAPLSKEEYQLFLCGIVCNDATLSVTDGKLEVIGDPTEAALLVSAAKAGMNWQQVRTKWPRVSLNPFDSSRKMMSTVNRGADGKTFIFSKGAPEMLLKQCTRILLNGRVSMLTDAQRAEILAHNEAYAKQALRVLGFAYREHPDRELKAEEMEADLVFLGLQGMIDPPREEVVGAIARCHDAGIRVIMITGDNGTTAASIAAKIGIQGEAMNGADFAKLPEDEQLKAIRRVGVFSRVAPEHKMRIVELLQKQGEVVAMTGDGVNDAPAIKKADLGIAMGITGTDVAKESSDMILVDDNFTSIVNAIEEGRGIYENVRKFVNYLLSCNLGEVFVLFFAILFGLPLPMTAIMLLWLNLVTDGLPALALSVDPNPPGLMKRPPKKSHEPIMTRGMLFNILYVSVLITAAVLGLFLWGLSAYEHAGEAYALMHAQTLAFTAIIVMEIVRLQAIRSEYKLGAFSNPYLVGAVLVSIGLQLAVVYTPLARFFDTVPLSGLDWGIILGAAVSVMLLNMLAKPLRNLVARQ